MRAFVSQIFSIRSHLDQLRQASPSFGRTLRLSAGLLAFGTCAAIGCSGEPSTKAGAPSDQGEAAPSALQASIQEDSQARFAGSLETTSGTALFDSQSDAVGGGISVVALGNRRIQWLRDAASGKLTVDGGNTVLDSDSLAAFRALRNELNARLLAGRVARSGLAAHEILLLAEVRWLADGQVGNSIGTFVPGHGNSRSGGEVAYSASVIGKSNAPGKSGDDGTSCLTKGTYQPFYAQSDEGKTRVGVFRVNDTMPCNGTTASGKSCSGDSAWDGQCMGQCGGGCQTIFNNGSYQDCFDHDFCTYYFKDCNEQFIYAADDYIDALTDGCN